MYMVVLNLRDNQTKLSITPAEVYGIGDAFTNWDEDAPANLFTVNNDTKTLVSPALPTSGNIRMYANHPWIPSWWNAEFNLYDGKIKYRNDGDDQEPVPGTAGNVITLSFDDNTGSIQ
ncbi:Outer membrane protein SusF [anaerobic digester metagenome]